jgi:hypothetical protein
MTGLRRAIGILQYLNKELVRAPEAIIRPARVPQSHPWWSPAGSIFLGERSCPPG